MTGLLTTMSNSGRGHDTQFIRRVEEADQHPAVLYLANMCIDYEIPITAVADEFGVSRATIYNWMTGKTVPRPHHLKKMPGITERLRKRHK